MSLSTGKTRLFQHVVAAFSALLIGWGVYAFISSRQLKPPYTGEYLTNMATGKTAVANLVALNSALDFGKTVVLFGSSELTSGDLTYIPYRFLPKALSIPVFAYGHAHFQSFGIGGMLRANAEVLSARTKLVIMVSPGWFNEPTTTLDSFIEHFRPQVLASLYQDPTAKDAIGRYLKQHLAEFKTITEFQRAFVPPSTDEQENDGFIDLKMRLALINEELFAFKTRARLLFEERRWLMNPPQVSPVVPSAAQWDAYESQARAEEISHMTGNLHWVRDDYYRKYLSDLPTTGINYFSDSMDPDPEFADLTGVLQFLQKKNVHALVVMQTLNPFVYKDASRIRPVAQRLAILCRQTGMQYFDMTTEDYTPGTMRDGMHLGELGWAQVDRRILEYLSSP